MKLFPAVGEEIGQAPVSAGQTAAAQHPGRSLGARQGWIRALGFTTWLGLVWITGIAASPARAEEISFLAGKELQQGLTQPLVGTWQNSELWPLLESLQQQQHLPVILDRRVDPGTLIDHAARGESVETLLRQLAQRAKADVVLTDRCAWLGPPSASVKLQTLLQSRNEDWQAWVKRRPAAERKRWQDESAASWEDGARPRDLAQQLARAQGLELVGGERIPHDVWRAARWPRLPAAEFWTLFLLEFDLTFQLAGDRAALEIVPIAPDIEWERSWNLSRPEANGVRRWLAGHEDHPGRIRLDGQRLFLRGKVDDIVPEVGKLNAQILASAAKPPATVDLALRQITLRAENVPLGAVLQQLESTGVPVRYDAQALKVRGISLEKTLVTIDVKEASFAEFLQQLATPLGLKARIEGNEVLLEVRQ